MNTITEYKLNWPSPNKMSTHELVCDASGIYVTGQNMNCLAKVTYDGHITFHPFEGNPGPHGLLIDAKGRLWVSFEFEGRVVCLDKDFNIVQSVDVRMYTQGAKTPINPAPHGIGLDADGETIWFTGKRTSTLGKINPNNGTVEHFELPQLAAMPIFLSAGPDNNIWGTQLLGNKIYNASKDGVVTEFPIPTTNSRPIAIIPDPAGDFMWFTEEAGNKIGRIDVDGNITEFSVPMVQKNVILGSLSFDNEGHIWVQCYVKHDAPMSMDNHDMSGMQMQQSVAENDYVVKFDKSIRQSPNGDIAGIPIFWYKTPSQRTMMHRIRMGNDGNLWFTEMDTDTLGKITLK